MRHVLLPGAITAGTRGMQKPTAVACLIAPAGSTSSVTSGLTGTIPGAVDVAAIAAAADRYLNAAAGTKEQPRRDRVVLIEPAGPPMTGAAIAAILPRHACPGTVWCTVPKRNLAVWTSAPCLPPIVRTGDACTSRFDQQCRRTARSVLPLTLTQMDGTPSRADPIPAADHRPAHLTAETSPDLRGFRPPSTCVHRDRVRAGRSLLSIVIVPASGPGPPGWKRRTTSIESPTATSSG